MLEKFITDAVFGLAFGCGFFVAKAVLDLLASLMGKAAKQNNPD